MSAIAPDVGAGEEAFDDVDEVVLVVPPWLMLTPASGAVWLNMVVVTGMERCGWPPCAVCVSCSPDGSDALTSCNRSFAMSKACDALSRACWLRHSATAPAPSDKSMSFVITLIVKPPIQKS
jgi:hypothetical protein